MQHEEQHLSDKDNLHQPIDTLSSPNPLLNKLSTKFVCRQFPRSFYSPFRLDCIFCFVFFYLKKNLPARFPHESSALPPPPSLEKEP